MGSETFGKEHTQLPFDQQPLEAQAVVEECADAWRITRKQRFRDYADGAYAWFLGRNDRHIPLADFVSGRCHNGLTRTGVNINSGAESILAFHASYCAIERLNAEAGDSDGKGGPSARIWQSERLANP